MPLFLLHTLFQPSVSGLVFDGIDDRCHAHMLRYFMSSSCCCKPASLALPARVVPSVWVLLVSFLLLGSTAGLHTTDMKITALRGYFF